jgi:hypothetical protein
LSKQIQVNRDIARTTDQEFRNGMAKKNPVLIVPNKKIVAWDEIPRFAVMD